ncbi:hypothetical protein D3C76_893210 [compost metagenome]
MVAEPLLLAADRRDEQVRPLQLPDHRFAVAAAGEGVAQRGAELAGDARLQEEVAAFDALAGEDVLGEVLGQFQVGPGERGDEGGMVVASGQRQAGQVQAGDPAFGAAVQRVDLVVAQGQQALVMEKRLGFLVGEAQVGGPDFQQLAAGADAPQADARHRARGQRHHAAAGQRVEQLLDEVEHILVVDHLELVEQQSERRLAGHDQVQQVVAVPGGLVRPEQLAQAVAQRRDEALEIVVAGVQVDPDGGLALFQAVLAILLEQRGLAEAGGGADEDQPGRGGPVDLFDEPDPGQMAGAGGGRGVLDRRGPAGARLQPLREGSANCRV